jgi:hypothetical protein
MGSTVSIFTNVALNIALRQITALYYENKVNPGERMVKTVAKAHFTIEARVYSGDNHYTDMDNIVPIAMISLGFVSLCAAGVAGICHIMRNCCKNNRSYR